MTAPAAVGIDAGGTFTDLVMVAPGGGPPHVVKRPASPDPSRALMDGLRAVGHGGVARLTYGTTVVTNALVAGAGARVALVTTRGFRDVLEIGRQQRDHLYRLDVPGRAAPAVPRALRFEVTERIDHQGRVLVPLAESEVRALADALRGAEVEAVAVCFLHAYANPVHERRAAALLGPHVRHVCLSSAVNPEFREYERSHTTCAHARVRPLVARHLGDLEAGLRAGGVRAPLELMQSNGGVASARQVVDRPLALYMSGPAAGVAAARAVIAGAGIRDAVALDMGGTSTDVCLIRDGLAESVTERRVLGQPVRLRSVAVESIGAGGGSIAWVDRAGALKVGPESAGAEPGPACYGRGGERATVTDAYVVLGVLSEAGAIGGVRLDPDLARRAIEPLAARFGMGVPEAAAGIVEIANAAMLRAIRTVSLERGVDPRALTLVAYGGAGPIHAGRLAALAGVPRALVPAYAGVFSACGCALADRRYDAVQSARVRLADDGPEAWEGPLRELEADLLARCLDDGVPPGRVVLQRSIDLRYVGQNYELEVPVAPGLDGAAVRARFLALHRLRYQYATDEPVEGVAVRAAAMVPEREARLVAPAAGAAAARSRPVFFYGTGWVEAPVHSRMGVPCGRACPGPAIVEDPWCTALVYPGQSARRDAAGLLWIEPS